MDKKLYLLKDQDETRKLLLTGEQAAVFYYLKDNNFFYDDDLELIPVETDTPIEITSEDYHYE